VEVQERGGAGEPLLEVAAGDALVALAHAADREEEGDVDATSAEEMETLSFEDVDEAEEADAVDDAEEPDAVTSAGSPGGDQFDLL
jgi:hypothetical protein